MNTKKLAITIGIVALVLAIACTALGFGESVYLSSNGQRGWSPGAAFYNAMGWGAEAYRTDAAQHMQQRAIAQAQPEAQSGTNFHGVSGFGSHRGVGFNGRRSGHGGFLFVLTAMGVAGYLYYRRQKQNQATTKAA